MGHRRRARNRRKGLPTTIRAWAFSTRPSSTAAGQDAVHEGDLALAPQRGIAEGLACAAPFPAASRNIAAAVSAVQTIPIALWPGWKPTAITIVA